MQFLTLHSFDLILSLILSLYYRQNNASSVMKVE